MELDAGGLDHRPDVDIDFMTFHCMKCNTVVGDSMSACGEFPAMDAIMFLRVTDSVTRNTEMEPQRLHDYNCLYRDLECTGCSSVLGFLVEAAPRNLETLRYVFLLYKENINCYVLEHNKMVASSEVEFDLKPIGERLDEFHAQLKQQEQEEQQEQQ